MYSSGEYLEFRIDRLSGDPLTIRFPNVAAAASEFSPSAALRRASVYNDAKNGSSGGMSPSGFMDFMRQNDFCFQPPARGGGAGGPAGVPALGAVVTDEPRSTTEDASRGTLLLTSGIVSVRRLRDRIRKFLQQDEAGRPVPDQVVMLIHPPAEDSGGADVVFQGDDTASDFWSRVFAGAADADLCQISLPAHPKKKDRFRAVPPEWCETVWRTFPVVLNSCAVRIDFANRRVVNFVAGRNAQLVYDSEADIVSLEHFEGTTTAADVPDGTPGGANEMGAGTASTACSTSTPTPEFLPLNDLQLVTRSYPQLVLRDMVDSLRDVIETGGRLQLIRRDSYSIGDWATAVYQANVYELNSSDWVARCLPPLVNEGEAGLPAAAGDEHDQTGGAGGPGLRTISSESRGEAAVAETNMRNHFANDQHGRYLSCNPNPRNLRGVYGSAGLESHPIYNANMNATYMKRLSGGKDGNQPSLLMQLLEMIFRVYQKYHAEPITEEWREALDRHIVECQCVILLLLRTPLLRDVHPGGWENQDDSPNGDSASSRYGRGPRSTSTAVESPLHELLRMYFLFSRTTSNFPGSEKYRSLRYFGGSSSAGARAAGASSGVFPGTRLNRHQHSTNASSGAEDEPEQSRQLIENIISINDGGAGASSGAAAASLSTAGAYLAAHEVVEETASNWIFAAFAEILHHPDCRADRMVNRFGQTPLYIAYEVYWEDKAAFTGSSSGCFAEDFGAFRKYYGAGTSAGSSSSGSILRAAAENLAMGGNLDDLREQFAAEVDWAALANGLLASGGSSALHLSTAAQSPAAGAGSVTKILSGADMFRALVLDGAARAPVTIVKQLREVLYCQLANGLEDRDWLVLLADLVELLGTSTSSGGGCLDAVLHQVADAADESRGSNTLLQLVLLSLSVESFTPHAWQSNRLAVDYGTAIFQMAPSVGQEAVVVGQEDDHDMGVAAQQDGKDQDRFFHEINEHDEEMLRNPNEGFQVSAALFDRLVRTGLAVRVAEPGLDAGISSSPRGGEQVAHFESSDAALGFLSSWSCPSKVLPLEQVGALKAFVIRTLFATGSAVMGATQVRIIRGPGGNAAEVDAHGEKMQEGCSEIPPTADTMTADDAPDGKPTATHVDFSGSQEFFTDKERAEPTAAHIRRGTLLLRHRLLPILAWSVGHANNNLLHRNGRGENVLHCLFQAKNFSFFRHMIFDKQYGWPFLELLFSGIRNANASETEVWSCKDSSGWTPTDLLKLFVKEHL